MKQAELIARLVSHHEMTPNDSMLRPEYFFAFAEEWQFVCEYYAQHKSYPNTSTLYTQFPNFEVSAPASDVEETAQWLADEVAQDYLQGQMAKALTLANDANEANPREAVKLAIKELQKLSVYSEVLTGEVVDLVRDSERRIKESERRREGDRSKPSGITFGFSLIDEATAGTQPGEIDIVFARTSEGKSIFLLHSALRAVISGKRVAYVSPEMNEYETGVRLDSMLYGVSSFKLQSGRLFENEWQEYLDAVHDFHLEVENSSLLFYDTEKLGRRFTTSDLAAIIQRENVDMLCLDGLMLIEPMKQDKDPRKRLLNTCDEIKAITTITNVPMRIAHQANRESVVNTGKRNKSLAITELLPELHHMAESGAVEQYATRAFSLKYHEGRMYCANRKNRNGKRGQIISMAMDIDRSIITDMRIEDGNAEIALGEAQPTTHQMALAPVPGSPEARATIEVPF